MHTLAQYPGAFAPPVARYPASSEAWSGTVEDSPRGDSRLRRLQAAREMLRARYFESITMHDLAAAACMSLHHFMRSYTAQFGHSAHEELVSLRIGLAEHLLTTTRLQVRQIAAAVGFESRTTLFRHFIRHHQRSPEQFRCEQARLDRILRCNASPSLLLRRSGEAVAAA
ncbi:MAG: helix-turn-helix transcriptional regulator [Xanthomonadales bacterium]|nr:helix-turn-helix transcriptional regulator [Xanthomonadales bacterium]MBP6078893.1 helix-turn-helix transcriptional regulator [Xanthomonadales bacterium]MBP7622368.1 helix-turn-helix transcriptional regulator [Xanthomonadales bacterium]